MAKIKVFTPDQFEGNQYYTAEQKAEWANRLAHFITSGFERGHFTRILYDLLHLHFGHIAHFDINGFYQTWFATPDQRVAFLKHTIEYPPSSPWFGDVEKAVQEWVKKGKFLETYQGLAQVEQHYQSVEDVARSLLKVNKAPTGELVEAKVQTARREVEDGLGGAKLEDRAIQAIVGKLKKEFCQNQETFILAAVSENTNSFGLHQHIFVARSGEAWACCGHRGPGGIEYKVNDKVTVKLVAGEPDWSSLGFEVPEKKSPPPPDLLKKLWGE